MRSHAWSNRRSAFGNYSLSLENCLRLSSNFSQPVRNVEGGWVVPGNDDVQHRTLTNALFCPLMIWLYKHIVQHKRRHICLLTQVVDANRFDKALAVAGVEVVAMVTTSNS